MEYHFKQSRKSVVNGSGIGYEEDENDDSGKLFSFITDSDFVKAAKEGDYSGIIDMLTTLRNTRTTFEIGVEISSVKLSARVPATPPTLLFAVMFA